MYYKNEGFTNKEAKLFWKAVEEHEPQLSALQAATGRIGVKGAKWLSKAIKAMPTIVEINLSTNPLGDKAVAVLAETLKDCPNITKLNLSTTSMGDQGMRALALAMSTKYFYLPASSVFCIFYL